MSLPSRVAVQLDAKTVRILRGSLGLSHEISGALNVSEKKKKVVSFTVFPGETSTATAHNLNEEAAFHTHPLHPNGLFPPSGMDYQALLTHATRFATQATGEFLPVDQLVAPNQQASVVVAGNGTWVIYPEGPIFQALNLLHRHPSFRRREPLWIAEQVSKPISACISIDGLVVVQSASFQKSGKMIFQNIRPLSLLKQGLWSQMIDPDVGLLVLTSGREELEAFQRTPWFAALDSLVSYTNPGCRQTPDVDELDFEMLHLPCRSPRWDSEKWQSWLRSQSTPRGFQITWWEGSTTPVVVQPGSPSSIAKKRKDGAGGEDSDGSPFAEITLRAVSSGSKDPKLIKTSTPALLPEGRGELVLEMDTNLIKLDRRQIDAWSQEIAEEGGHLPFPGIHRFEWDQMLQELNRVFGEKIESLVQGRKGYRLQRSSRLTGSLLRDDESVALLTAEAKDPLRILGVPAPLVEPSNPYVLFQRVSAARLGFRLDFFPADQAVTLDLVPLTRETDQVALRQDQGRDIRIRTSLAGFNPAVRLPSKQKLLRPGTLGRRS